MKYPITQFKSLEVALKELERFVRNGEHLLTGRGFQRLGDMRSREAWANWLLCAALSKTSGHSLAFTSDPMGGDGLIIDSVTRDAVAQIEHVMVPSPHGSVETEPKTLILRAVDKKRDKGAAYADGKTLCVFLNTDVGNRTWCPNEVARALPDPLYFKDVWVVGFANAEGGEYAYDVVLLDLSDGDAPIIRLRIAKDFTSW
jgi:hypothetical protein